MTLWKKDCITRCYAVCIKREKTSISLWGFALSEYSLSERVGLFAAAGGMASNIYLHVSKDHKHILANEMRGTFNYAGLIKNGLGERQGKRKRLSEPSVFL